MSGPFAEQDGTAAKTTFVDAKIIPPGGDPNSLHGVVMTASQFINYQLWLRERGAFLYPIPGTQAGAAHLDAVNLPMYGLDYE